MIMPTLNFQLFLLYWCNIFNTIPHITLGKFTPSQKTRGRGFRKSSSNKKISKESQILEEFESKGREKEPDDYEKFVVIPVMEESFLVVNKKIEDHFANSCSANMQKHERSSESSESYHNNPKGLNIVDHCDFDSEKFIDHLNENFLQIIRVALLNCEVDLKEKIWEEIIRAKEKYDSLLRRRLMIGSPQTVTDKFEKASPKSISKDIFIEMSSMSEVESDLAKFSGDSSFYSNHINNQTMAYPIFLVSLPPILRLNFRKHNVITSNKWGAQTLEIMKELCENIGIHIRQRVQEEIRKILTFLSTGDNPSLNKFDLFKFFPTVYEDDRSLEFQFLKKRLIAYSDEMYQEMTVNTGAKLVVKDILLEKNLTFSKLLTKGEYNGEENFLNSDQYWINTLPSISAQQGVGIVLQPINLKFQLNQRKGELEVPEFSDSDSVSEESFKTLRIGKIDFRFLTKTILQKFDLNLSTELSEEFVFGNLDADFGPISTGLLSGVNISSDIDILSKVPSEFQSEAKIYGHITNEKPEGHKFDKLSDIPSLKQALQTLQKGIAE